MMGGEGNELELTIVMPCLNEAETVGICVTKALEFLRRNNVKGEVIVADNGSTDGSPDIASKAGARVVRIPEKGYGNAIRGGIEVAQGRYVIVGDSDDSYDFLHLEPFLEKLREGFDLVMGNRFKGVIAPGAMPFLHKWLGNPVLTGIGRLLFGSPCGDFHCGLRGFRKEAAQRMMLQTPGMEFASEMVVKATLLGMRITEVPTTLSKAGRTRPSHLRSWRDGWRHLRFLLLLSPKWLFGLPGGVLASLGGLLGAITVLSPGHTWNTRFEIPALFACALGFLAGSQILCLWFFATIIAMKEGTLLSSPKAEKIISSMTLESGLIAGLTVFLIGIIVLGLGALANRTDIRIIVLATTIMVLGFQILFSSFFIETIKKKK